MESPVEPVVRGLKNTKKPPPPYLTSNTGHNISVDNFNIVGRESEPQYGNQKALFIRA